MKENLKKVGIPNNKQSIIQAFTLGQPPIYDMTPPEPLSYPKMLPYPLDNSRHYSHKFPASFFQNCKPLLIGCDVGMPVDELILFANEYNYKDAVLDQQDQALINQTIMNVKQDQVDNTNKMIDEKVQKNEKYEEEQ